MPFSTRSRLVPKYLKNQKKKILLFATIYYAFISGYGLTETTCLVTAMPEDMEGSRCESLGPPGIMTEVKVVGGDGKALPLGQVGELCVRGPQIVRGYLGNPEATSAAITPDGWLCTGDLAFLDPDHAHVHVVDRLKELIKVKGFQV